MNKLSTLFSKRSFSFLISALFASVICAQSFSPTVNVTLSNNDCGLSADLSIHVDQDSGETDIDASIFSSDVGSFDLSTLLTGDTVGMAALNFNSGSSVTTDLIVGATSNLSTVVLSIDASNGSTLGSFTMSNSSNGGILVTATSPGDGNTTTGGYTSTATFYNLFVNPNNGVLNFYSTINSELGQSDSQSFMFYLSCLDFSPTVSVSLSNLNCDSLADLTVSVAQDAGEADIASAVFSSDGGQFTISLMNVGDVIGTATMIAGSNSYNTDLVVATVVSSNQAIISAIDNISGLSIGTFDIENTLSGINVTATSPADGNSTTSGNSSTATFNNIFHNPNNGALTFTATSTSELGSVYSETSVFMMSCVDFTPTVSVSLSNLFCDSVSDLTINVAQDANEVDMDTAIFLSDSGSFSISTMNIADMIGSATMTYGGNISLTADLYVLSTVSPDLANIEAIDVSSGMTLGSFLIENLSSGGVSVTATSPADGNSLTNGNSSTVTFNGIYTNSSNSLTTFTSNITSELGDLDTQSFSFNINCITYSPNVGVSLLNLDCDSLNDLTITVSQDPYEVDMDTANFSSDSGSFTISTMSVGDTIGFASLSAGPNSFTTDLLVSSIVSSNQVIVESIDINSGLVLGTFDISNNLTGGVSVIATSPADGNNITLTGNSSSVTFSNVFLNPNASTLNFTSTITSELGDVDTQSFSFNIVCQCITQYLDVVITACDNFTWDGVVYDSTGLYINTYTDLLGCDSIVTLNLTINNSSAGSVDITACDNFTWDGVVYDATGSYTNTYTGVNGCDSLMTLNLTINNSFNSLLDTSTCDDFTWLGVVYDSSGTYTNMYTDVNGCDSTFTLNLIINYSSNSSVDITACDNFTWDGVVYDSTGSYTNIYTVNGCDSSMTLNLTIVTGSSGSVDITACDDFTWDGFVYNSTGSYTNTYTDANGCDSLMTLNLTINNSSSGSVDITTCDDFTWDGVVYDSTGSYTNIYTGANGCDSIMTLNLTIAGSVGSVDITACDDFTWDGVVYDSTGSYTNTYTDVNGCDSVMTLNLTINVGPVVEIIYNSSLGTLTANNITGSTSPYTWLWNTGELTQSISVDPSVLSYWCVVSDANGCLSDTAYFSITTGVDEILDSRLLVYPNPVNDILNIDFTFKNNQSVELKIVNILGEVMYSEKVTQTELSYSNKFDFSKFSKGLYFVKLKLDKNIITQKVILQ
ncbi:T9SS type A sorting domain-containing protein [Flavobacteriales bacterium]|nr:T9SS type A sorting domain-containing protein [Flavobacteriales bacterium]